MELTVTHVICLSPETEALLRDVLKPSPSAKPATVPFVIGAADRHPRPVPAPAPKAASAPSRPVGVPRPVPRAARKPSPWSDERLLALQIGWERGDEDSEILAVINALPGERIISRKTVVAKALDENFVRPRPRAVGAAE